MLYHGISPCQVHSLSLSHLSRNAAHIELLTLAHLDNNDRVNAPVVSNRLAKVRMLGCWWLLHAIVVKVLCIDD